MDYLIPTAWETPKFELGETVHAVAAPPDRREGRRRVGHGRLAGRVRQRGDRRAVRTSGVRNIDMPVTSREGVGGDRGGEGGHLRVKPDVLRARGGASCLR